MNGILKETVSSIHEGIETIYYFDYRPELKFCTKYVKMMGPRQSCFNQKETRRVSSEGRQP